MSEFDPGNITILFADSGSHLAYRIGEILNVKVINARPDGDYADGEIHVKIPESIRGKSAYIIGSTCQPASNADQIRFLSGAVFRAGATPKLVIPYLGFSRQDRVNGREADSAALHIQSLCSPVPINHVVTFDVHSSAILSTFILFGTRVEHLYASQFAVPYIKQNVLVDMVASPDVGGVARAKKWRDLLGLDTPIAICSKSRPQPNVVNQIEVVGDVRGFHVLVPDDMIDTGGTTCRVADALLNNGAASVSVFASHGLFSGEAIKKLDDSGINRVIITDSLYHPPEKLQTSRLKIEILKMSPLIAEAIKAIENDGSISTLFLD